MARRVVWSARAEADIAALGAYLERVASLAVATSVITKIRAAARGVADFPYACRMIPELEDPNRRETFVHKYRLMYRVEPSCIHMLRVVHGQRLIKNVPGGFEESSQPPYIACREARMADTAKILSRQSSPPRTRSACCSTVARPRDPGGHRLSSRRGHEGAGGRGLRPE